MKNHVVIHLAMLNVQLIGMEEQIPLYVNNMKNKDIEQFKFEVTEDIEIIKSFIDSVDEDITDDIKTYQFQYRISRIYKSLIDLKILKNNKIPFNIIKLAKNLFILQESSIPEDLMEIKKTINQISTIINDIK